MHTSKAFRRTLPSGLRDDQLSNIRHWAYLHCAQSGFFRDDHGSVVFCGLKDEFRTSASFARTIRTALQPLHRRTTKGALVLADHAPRSSEHLRE